MSGGAYNWIYFFCLQLDGPIKGCLLSWEVYSISVLVQFCPWSKFYFALFWGKMVIWDNEFDNEFGYGNIG